MMMRPLFSLLCLLFLSRYSLKLSLSISCLNTLNDTVIMLKDVIHLNNANIFVLYFSFLNCANSAIVFL